MGIQRFFGVIVLIILPLTGVGQSLQLADSLHNRGIEFYDSGNYRQAEFYLREAYQLYKKNGNNVWLKPGIDYAEILVSRSKYQKALALFDQLKNAATAHNHINALAQIENDLGWTYSKIGEMESALYHYKLALPLAKQVNDTLRLGYIYDNIGGIYHDWNNYEKSLEYRKQALSHLEQLDQPGDISITLNNIGVLYEELALYDKALEYYERSLAIRKNLGNVYLLASIYNNIAHLYKTFGRFDKAIINYEKSLGFSKKAGNPSQTAIALNNIGTLYNKLGQPQRALEYYQESLQLKKPFAGPGSIATTYKNIANRFWDLNRPEEAFDYYTKSLNLRKQAGNPRLIAQAFLDLARFEKKQHQFKDEEKYIEQALAIANAIKDRSLQQEVASLRGALELARGNYASALDHYKKALKYGRSLERGAHIRSLKGLANAYHQLNSDSALYYGQQAIDLIEKLRSQTGTLSRFKSGYFKRHADFYKTMASWTLEYKNNAEEAFRLVESAKARALTDELAEAAQRIDESLPEEERVARAQQLSEISDLYSQLESTADPDKEQAIRQKIRNEELAYASFEQRLQQQYGQYMQLKSPRPISLSRAQKLSDTETAILEYALTSENLLIFLIAKDQVKTAQINLSPNASADSSRGLHDQIKPFREAIISRVSEDSLQILSTPLYELLIAPFKQELAAYKNLLIVPDDFLAYVPFEVLYSDNYLVSQFNIKYAPSITGFSLIQNPINTSTASILAIGNADRYASSGSASILPSVDYEIRSITNLFDESVSMADREVTETAVKRRVQDSYPFIHIAAHSIIDERNSSQSGIILGDGTGENGIGNDGYLRSSEIYRLNINSAMVVLSACKSGMGDLISGEGLLGLERAFFNAGTSTVVVSLWDVYDRSTTRLMKHFYSLLMEKNGSWNWLGSWQSFLRWAGWDKSVPFGSPASAMREAKLAMLDHPKYRHPVYWAPFVVVGR